jgi:hypothetical protein
MATSRQYFELQPINNVREFSYDAGQDVINFIVPSVNNAVLDGLRLCGNLQINTDSTTPYLESDITDNSTTSTEIGIDNSIGLHAFISKVEINSRRANVSLEQRQQYDLIAKLDRASTMNAVDAGVGENDNMVVGSSFVRGSMNKLTRAALADNGVPFCVPINCGLLTKADSKLALQSVGGIQISIFLNSTKQALFNVDNANTVVLNNNTTYNLTNVKLMGRYQYLDNGTYSKLSAIGFKQVSNNLQIIQSSNDTIVLQPMVSSMDKLSCVAQPNNTTRNNFNKCGTQVNEVIGQRSYRIGRNGLQFPYDFDVNTVTSASDKLTTTADDNVLSGCAEQVLHQSIALNGSYPPHHSMAGAVNEASAFSDLYELNDPLTGKTADSNENVNNLRSISVSYQYGFAGYTSNFSQDQINVQVNSAVKTTNAELPQPPLDQTQTMNNLSTYNSVLNYANLAIQR